MPDEPPSDRPPPGRTGIVVDISSAGVRPGMSRAVASALVRFVLRRTRVRHAIVSVSFVSNRRISALNREVFGRAGVTDVVALAFRRPSARAPVIGDIYIATDVVRANARRAGVTAREETARVVVHGVLHALGRDHPDAGRESSAMWREQERYVLAARREGVW